MIAVTLKAETHEPDKTCSSAANERQIYNRQFSRYRRGRGRGRARALLRRCHLKSG